MHAEYFQQRNFFWGKFLDVKFSVPARVLVGNIFRVFCDEFRHNHVLSRCIGSTTISFRDAELLYESSPAGTMVDGSPRAASLSSIDLFMSYPKIHTRSAKKFVLTLSG